MSITGLVLLIGIVASVWVFFDAPEHGLSRSWALGVFLLWIVALPWYMVRRNHPASWEQPARPVTGRWEPDPRNPSLERYREGTRWTNQIRPRS
jgi:4-amino-4-deoxy-L-arabinose transferase-like glycosyltransferase